MKRRPIIAGNWKMNLNLKEAINLAETIVKGSLDIEDRDIIIFPPFTYLYPMNHVINSSGIFLGAQNMYWEITGAFTGEISGIMLKDVGCTHVILGHSERRTIFHESDEEIANKIKTAIEIGLYPILCVGENLEQRKIGKTFEIITHQLNSSLKYMLDSKHMPPSFIIAYEPIWAIGTGHTATPDQAQEVHIFIRNWIKKEFGDKIANSVRILYGGSVKPENIKELMAEEDIDGVLVGGASLKADSFLKIIRF